MVQSSTTTQATVCLAGFFPKKNGENENHHIVSSQWPEMAECLILQCLSKDKTSNVTSKHMSRRESYSVDGMFRAMTMMTLPAPLAS